MNARELFAEAIQDNATIQRLLKKESLTFEDADRFTAATSREFAKSLRQVYPVEVTGDMDVFIKEELVPMLNHYFMLHKTVGENAQAYANKKNGIGLSVKSPTSKGIIGDIARACEDAERNRIVSVAFNKVKTFGRTIIADTMKENIEMQGGFGLRVSVYRHNCNIGLHGKGEPCAYCDRWEGLHIGPNIDPEVFGFHDGCECWLEYTNEGGETTILTTNKSNHSFNG